MRLDATLAIRRDMMAQAEANLQTICASSGRLHEEVKAKEERAAKEREVVGGLEATVKKEDREKEAMEAEWKEEETKREEERKKEDEEMEEEKKEEERRREEVRRWSEKKKA